MRSVLIILTFVFICTSCSKLGVQKRRYKPGFYFSSAPGHKKTPGSFTKSIAKKENSERPVNSNMTIVSPDIKVTHNFTDTTVVTKQIYSGSNERIVKRSSIKYSVTDRVFARPITKKNKIESKRKGIDGIENSFVWNLIYFGIVILAIVISFGLRSVIPALLNPIIFSLCVSVVTILLAVIVIGLAQ